MTPTSEDREGLAIEYALGTLPEDAFLAANQARQMDKLLDQAIKDWENRLSPLLLLIPDATPSPTVWTKIEQRIEAQESGATTQTSDLQKLRGQMRFWRALAMMALLALLAAFGLLLRPMPQPPAPLAPNLVAALQKEATSPAFLISLDETQQALKIVALGEPAPAGKDYELWIIADGLKAPRSLGVVHQDNAQRPADLRGLTAAAVHSATLAISLEPAGGSPTGTPTGPVLFTGKFVTAKL